MSPSKDDVEKFQWLINRSYFVNLVLDTLPAIYANPRRSLYVGFPLGFKKGDDYYVNSHITLKVTRTSFEKDTSTYRILEFNIVPKSLGAVDDNNGEKISYCSLRDKGINAASMPAESEQIIKEGEPIYFSYDVVITEDKTKTFASRWDH